MIPQIIFIVLIVLNLVIMGYEHGKEKKGKYNAYISFFALSLQVALMAWGGFFDALFK